MAQTPAILGEWFINANGSNGHLVVSAMDSGDISGTVFNNSFIGFWDADARKITFARIPAGEVSEAFQVFTGYWFQAETYKQVLVGSFEVFQGNAHRSVYGWFASHDVFEFAGNAAEGGE